SAPDRVVERPDLGLGIPLVHRPWPMHPLLSREVPFGQQRGHLVGGHRLISEALNEYPGARGLEDFITATDVAGIRDQARRLRERGGGDAGDPYDQMRQQARDFYGPSGGGPGGAPPGLPPAPVSPDMEKERRMWGIAERWNDWRLNDAQRPSNKEVDQFAQFRFVDQVLNAVRRNAT